MSSRILFILIAGFWITMNFLLWRAEYSSQGGGEEVPVKLVWRKILTAPDSSSLSIYQQGEKFSLFVINIDDNCMLVVIFKSQTGVGIVKYFSGTAVKRIACQLEIAQERAPGIGLDLSVLNVAETGQFFRKREA